MGKEAAMACTVAVEDVIGDHYNSQIREIVEDDPEKHKDLLEVKIWMNYTISISDWSDILVTPNIININLLIALGWFPKTFNFMWLL